MKIALCYDVVLPALRYGGVERIVMGLAHRYREMGHQVFLFCRKGSQLPDFEHAFFPENWNGGDYAPLLPSDVDFIHIHQSDKLPSSKPYLVTIHGNASPGEKFLPNTNFVSHSHAQNHNAKYYVLQGIEVEKYPLEKHKQDYVVFMAKAKWRVKNLRTCIDFAHDNKILLKVIGGEGRNSKYVEYLGLLGDHEGRLDILAKARALLYPTNWDEPCALAPLEAMACGTPVIGSYNGSMPEEVLPGTGFLCKNYREFVGSFDRLNNLKPESIREIVTREFSSQRMAQDYLKLYQLIMERGTLDQSPHHAHDPKSVHYLFKPTLTNQLLYFTRGKI